jgi:hypothetical protein
VSNSAHSSSSAERASVPKQRPDHQIITSIVPCRILSTGCSNLKTGSFHLVWFFAHPAGGEKTTGQEGRTTMKFQDLFVPRWQHSDPDVRKRAVGRMKDVKILRQIAEKDDNEMVRQTALEQLKQLNEQVEVTQ